MRGLAKILIIPILAFSFSIISYLLILPNSIHALDAKGLFKKTAESVVLIMSFDNNNQPLAIGSGFYIHDGKKIVTNHHVIAGAAAVRIKKPDGKVFEATTVLGLDVEHDLAILEAVVPGRPIRLSRTTPEIGEDIIAIGNPKGLEATLSTGIVSGVRNDQGSIFYQVTAPISPGSSGGPIINENGEAIAVSTFYVQGGQNLNFAMPAAYIHKLLNSPRRISIAEASIGKPTKRINAVVANVKVVDYHIDGLYDNLEASIFNGGSFPIQNIRLVVTFYVLDVKYPVHFKLINVKKTIPTQLSIRFTKSDPVFHQHGSFRFQEKGGWIARFRILDYDIVQATGGSGRMPVFE